MTEPIGGDLKAIFKERHGPTGQNGQQQRLVLQILQVAVPGIGHEEIGDDQETDGNESVHRGKILTQRARDAQNRRGTNLASCTVVKREWGALTILLHAVV